MFSKTIHLQLLTCLLLLVLNLQVIKAQRPFYRRSAQSLGNWNPKLTPYPKEKTVDKTFSFASAKAGKNVTIPDPYYWLEGQIDKDPAVEKFISDQTALTETFMEKCKNKQIIQNTVSDAYKWNVIDEMYEFDSADVKNPFYLYKLKKDGENRPTWYIANPSEMQVAQKNNFATIPGNKFLNETLMSVNGTASIGYINTNPVAQTFAYWVTDLNSDVGTWYLRDLSSPLVDPSQPIIPGGYGRKDDVLQFTTGQLAHTTDNKGFVYVQTQDSRGGYNTNQGNAVLYHEIGTPQEKDIVMVHPEPETAEGVSAQWFLDLSFDGKWLFLFGAVDTSNHARAYATQLTGQTISDKMKWLCLAPAYEYTFGVFQTIGDTSYLTTDNNALDSKIVKVNLDWSKAKTFEKSLNELTDRAELIDVVPEKPLSTLTGAAAIGIDKAIGLYIEKGKYTTYIYSLKTGKLIEQILPKELSNIYGIYLSMENGNTVIVMYENLLTPRKIYQVKCSEGDQCQTNLITKQVIQGVKDTDYITKEYSAKSRDGTLVPYYVTSKKDTQTNRMCGLMHIFGSYGYIENFIWRPVFFAFATSYGCPFIWGSPRGGGDEGEKWHELGQRHLKQNTFDDIVAISQDLINRNIVAPGKLGIDGGSAGGLAALVAANQAPVNTYGAVFAGRSVCDYTLRRRSRGGADQIDEFGDVYNATDFDYIIDWSPYQNIQAHEYPAILFTPGTGDDRVVAAHSFKCLARLQALHPTNPNPLLMRAVAGGQTVDNLATSDAIDEAVHQLCVAELSMGLKNNHARKK